MYKIKIKIAKKNVTYIVDHNVFGDILFFETLKIICIPPYSFDDWLEEYLKSVEFDGKYAIVYGDDDDNFIEKYILIDKYGRKIDETFIIKSIENDNADVCIPCI